MMRPMESIEASMDSIGRIIDQDVALAAKILQLGNSAFFGLPHEVTNVKAALLVLGLDVLRQLVLSAEILTQFMPQRPVVGFSMDGFERHSRRSWQVAALLPCR